MSHNRSFFALEFLNREESVQFQTVSPHPPSRHCSLSGIRFSQSEQHAVVVWGNIGHSSHITSSESLFVGMQAAIFSLCLVLSVFFFCFFFTSPCFVPQEDMETSKYVYRMCLARLKFYKLNKSSL